MQRAALVTNSGVLAGPFLCIGEAQSKLNNFELAAEAYSRAIKEISASEGVFSPYLVQPYEGLGRALMLGGDPVKAEEALVTAKDLTHRNFGIYNLLQTPLVNRLTRLHYNRGELSKAAREQRFLLRANEETYGETPRLLPALRRQAKWLELVGRPDLARNNYRRSIAIMERAYGPDDLRLTGPLRDYADSYTNTPRGANRIMSRSGANALRRVIQIHDSQTFSDEADLAEAWGALGDWYVISGQRGRARQAYAQAGAVIEATGEPSSQFAQPKEIEFEPVPIGYRRSRLAQVPEGVAVVEFEFTVDAHGRVKNATVIRDDLNYRRFAVELSTRLKAARYRPRVVNGQAVATPGVRRAFRFDLSEGLPPDVRAAREQAAGDASNAVEGTATTEGEAPVSPTPDTPDNTD